VDHRWLNSDFEKPLRSETRITKIDETCNELQVKEYFRKRIELRSVRFKISNIISESFRFFVPPRKNLNFLRRRQSRRYWSLSRKGIEILYPGNSLRRHSNFLKPCKATVGIMVISSELVVGFSSFKSLLDASGKGKFDGTSKKFGLSITNSLI
jgi:hypothetical protein